MNLGEERKPTVTTEAAMQDSDARLSAGSLTPQQLQVMANPNYERLVKLIYEGDAKHGMLDVNCGFRTDDWRKCESS